MLAVLILIASPVAILRTPIHTFPNIDIPVIAPAWQIDAVSKTGGFAGPGAAGLTITLVVAENGLNVGYAPRLTR